LAISLQGQTGFDAGRAFGFLEEQVALGTREPNSPGAARAVSYYQAMLKPLADEVILQRFELRDPYAPRLLKLTNVIARFQPELETRVILCAHWDTRPRADYDPLRPDDPILGANDGASGVAVLLEFAHQLAAEPANIGIDIILFDGEDYGKEGDLQYYLLGSRHYVDNPIGPLPREVILLDMIGDAELELPIELNSWQSAAYLVDAIWTIGEELGYQQFVRRFGQAIYDDHIPFIQAGIPAIDIIDFQYPNATTNYWHTHQDTPDKCSPESLDAVGNTVLTWIYRQ
jgi:hypothetical protein